MLPLKQVDAQLATQEKKLRYLLSKNDDPWLNKNKNRLQDLLNLFENLANEGLNQDDLFEQFMYTNDLIKYSEVKEIMLNEYRNIENDSSPSILSFENSMYNQMQLHRQRIRNEVDKDYTTNILKEGLIRLTMQPNKMFALKNNILLSTKNENCEIQVAVDEMKYYYTITINGRIYTAQYDYDNIIGLQKTTTLPNYHDHYLQYELDDDKYNLYFYSVNIDINTKIIDIALQESKVGISKIDMEQFFSILPFNVTVYMQAFKTTGDDPFECFKTSLIRTQLETVNDQIVRSFNDKYAKDITYGLYGQGAMIGVSQVYELAKTAVRAVNTEYSVKTSPELEVTRMPETFPSFEDLIKDKSMLNKIDIIGSTLMPDKGAFLSDNTWQIRIQRSAMPGIINYQESAGQIQSGFDIVSARLNVSKGDLNRYLSDGTISSAKYWIENVVTPTGILSAIPVNKAKTSNGYCDVTYDACIEVPEYRYKVHGVRVNLIDSKLEKSETVTVINGYQINTISSTALRMIIWPDDLATEGSSNTQVTLTYTLRGTSKTITSTAVKQQIEYGSGQITVYVVNIEMSFGQYKYIIGTGFDMQVVKIPVEVYTTRDSDGFGENLVLLDTMKYPNIKTEYTIKNCQTALKNTNSTIPGRAIRPGKQEKPRANVTYQSANTTFLTSQNAPWSMPTMDTDVVGWINFDSPIKCENGVDWSDIVMERSFSGYDSFGPWDDIPDLVYTLDDGDHSSNWSLLKVNWNGSFPEIKKGTYGAYMMATNVNANFKLTDIVMNLDEVVLPAGVLNQGIIVESIVNLQRAVEYLQNYASYLKYLIDNLDARLSQVEETLQQVVEVLTTMINGKQGILGVVSDVVGFIGTGVGMFFPLIGLGITIIGQILRGADEINEGDIVTGSMDIVTGGLMSALGIRKFNQRLRRKYGAQQIIPGPNDGLPSYEEAMSMPGYGCISIKRDIDPFSYGAARNVWYDFSGDVLVIHGDVYPNSNLKLNTAGEFTSFKISGVETWEKSEALRSGMYSRTGVNFTASTIGFTDIGEIKKSDLSDIDLIFLLGIDTNIAEYSLIMYLYGTGSIEPFSKETAFDPDNLDTIMISNGIIIKGNTRSMRSMSKSKQLQRKKNWTLKYKNQNEIRSLENEIRVSPLLPISHLFAATNPVIQSMESQEMIFRNIYNAVIAYVNKKSS